MDEREHSEVADHLLRLRNELAALAVRLDRELWDRSETALRHAVNAVQELDHLRAEMVHLAGAEHGLEAAAVYTAAN